MSVGGRKSYSHGMKLAAMRDVIDHGMTPTPSYGQVWCRGRIPGGPVVQGLPCRRARRVVCEGAGASQRVEEQDASPTAGDQALRDQAGYLQA